jgi:mannan endo-1,4-beta-mannosidase
MRNLTARRRFRSVLLAAAVAVTVPLGAGPASSAIPAAPTTPTTPSPAVDPARNQFVTRVGARLELAGRPYRFAGSNNYYPMYAPDAMVDGVFDKAAAADFDVLRVWGSREIGTPGGTDSVNPSSDGFYLQYWDAEAGRPAFNDTATGFQRLDRVLAAARARGIRLVIPLVNNWNNFGGMDQYVRWAGKQYHDDFYTDATIRQWYRAWIAHVLNRVNPLTGIAYKDDPTVLMWELGNEPRCVSAGVYPRSPSGCTTDTLTSWAGQMSTYVKSLDRHHLVGVGDEGFYAKEPASSDWTRNGADGVDSIKLSSLRDVDVMGFHLYPDGWGKGPAEQWGRDWIVEHAQDARAIRKPLFLGEFGSLDKTTRNRVYRTWTRTFASAGGTGELYWLLSDVGYDGQPYPDYDGFTVYCPSPVCTTLSNAGKILRREGTTFAPVADDDTVTAEFGKTATLNLTANDVSYAPGALRPATVDLDPATAGRQRTVSVAAGTVSVVADGTLTYTPAEGFSGKGALAYTVSDSAGRTSNRATVTLVTKPDAAAALSLFSFEDGVQGWAEQSWDQLGGTVTGTTDFATDGTHGVRIDSKNEWFGLDLGSALDLSGKTTFKADLRTGDVGSSVSVVLKTGDSWAWCQGPFVWYGPRTTATVTADLRKDLSCDGAPPDLTQVRGVFLFFNEGSFLLDNLRVE